MRLSSTSILALCTKKAAFAAFPFLFLTGLSQACSGYEDCISAGRQSAKLSNYPQAILHFQKAISRKENYQNNLNYMLARMYFETQQYEQAVIFFDKFDSRVNSLAESQIAVLWRSRAHIRLGEIDMARYYFDIVNVRTRAKWSSDKSLAVLELESTIKEELKQSEYVTDLMDKDTIMRPLHSDVMAADFNLTKAVAMAQLLGDYDKLAELKVLSKEIDRAKIEQGTNASAISRSLMQRVKWVHVGEPATIDFPILFVKNSTELEVGSRRFVEALGKALSSDELRGAKFTLIGHADSDGKRDYNLKLSQDRAEAIKAALISLKPSLVTRNISVIGMGEEEPKYEGDTESVKRLNRRLEIEVYK